MKKVDLVIDMQFGSTGKGLIAGYLAEKYGHDVVLTANMPNAGHTYINAAGRKWVHKALPSGITSPNLKIVGIGPGAVFDVNRLLKEIEDSADVLNGKEVWIHECAAVLSPRHKEKEASTLSAVSSTMQGSAAATVEKMMRDPNSAVLARNCLEHNASIDSEGGLAVKVRVVSNKEWIEMLYAAKRILAEGAQGYSLGLNAGFWPYCTSRDCTPARFMADMAIPLGMLNNTVGTMRCHPIRVGNTADGFSGPCYPDQKELTWEELGVEPETTTVTGRIRRVFSFSYQQAREAILACQPTHIFLNFCNYDEQLADFIEDWIDGTYWSELKCTIVAWKGHGATVLDVEETYDVDF